MSALDSRPEKRAQRMADLAAGAGITVTSIGLLPETLDGLLDIAKAARIALLHMDHEHYGWAAQVLREALGDDE